jgi:hypothetical protein
MSSHVFQIPQKTWEDVTTWGATHYATSSPLTHVFPENISAFSVAATALPILFFTPLIFPKTWVTWENAP